MNKRFKNLYLHAILGITAFSSISGFYAQQRETIDLNRDWKFTYGYEVSKSAGSVVNLPHTWSLDAMSGKIDYFRGQGIYQREVFIPADWEGRTIYMRAGSAGHEATVLVNGKTVGTHVGGYTAFGFDISQDIQYGKKNTIQFRLSNAQNLARVPLVGDFNFYGGLSRGVELIVLSPNHIATDHLASNGVRVIQNQVSKTEAKITLRVDTKGSGKLKINLIDAENRVVASADRNISASQNKAQTVEVPFELKNPHLWNGLEDPYLYRAEIQFGDDQVTQDFGLRFYKVDDNNQFWLNGNILQIHGVGRHEEFAAVGNAISKEQMEEDIQLMLEMGVNAVRLTHYPHNPYFLDLCDKYGIIAWSEIPFVGPGGYRDKGFVNTEAFKSNTSHTLSEMIQQYYNHPSILFWGLFNEINQNGDDPLDFVKALNQQAKQDDPTRLTVAASNQGGALNTVSDLIGQNLYFGWYGGKPDHIGDWGKNQREKNPNLKYSVSEYGAGASPFQQQDELKQVVPTSHWHPENWQTYYHERHWKAIDEGKYFWGTFVWVMFDFYAAHRTEGYRDGINDKGLVTIDRKTKKDAFYFYKANWNQRDKFVYIAERRNNVRANKNQSLKVYSNLPEVELKVNGKSLGKKKSEGHGIFRWENVTLLEGKNTITASVKGTSDDTAEIRIDPSFTKELVEN